MSQRGMTLGVMQLAAVAALVAVAVVLAVVPPEGAAPEPESASLRHETTAPQPRIQPARDDGLWVVRAVPARAARGAPACAADACALRAS